MTHAAPHVRVSPDEETPIAVTLRGRTHRVVRLLDAWRVGGRWWRGETPSDHYRVELEGGATLRIRRQDGAWRVEGVDD